MTDHPLTETAAAEMWDASPCPEGYEFRGMLTVEQDATVYAMRAAFDAGREHEREHVRPAEVTEEMRRAAVSAYEDMAQVTRPENHEKCLNAALSAALAVATPADPRHDPRPWEPPNGPVRVGDEVRQDLHGLTHAAVVGRLDDDGYPWTAEGNFIGRLDFGTWYVRRPLPELPTEPGAVIVANDGHEAITATLGGETYHAREAILFSADAWLGAWRDTAGARAYMGPTRITPGTWKVDGK